MRTASTVPQRIKDRAEALRLSAHGWYIGKIAAYLNWSPQTVRDTIHRWNTKEMLELAAVAGEIELMEQTRRRGRR